MVNAAFEFFRRIERNDLACINDSDAVGKLIGLLDGSHRTEEIKTVVVSAPRDAQPVLTHLMDTLQQYECLRTSPDSVICRRWFEAVQDRETVHLGHAALLYRQQDNVFLFDPWLLPWFAESPVPSLWPSLLPKPTAIFLTHDHDDHVDPRTLLHLPKDTPVIVPSRRNKKHFFYDYPALLRELGFGRVVELAHGDVWPFEGGTIASVPFYGEDPRCCSRVGPFLRRATSRASGAGSGFRASRRMKTR